MTIMTMTFVTIFAEYGVCIEGDNPANELFMSPTKIFSIANEKKWQNALDRHRASLSLPQVEKPSRGDGKA